jgi:RNA polymerase sigma factor (sigma-70 family)
MATVSLPAVRHALAAFAPRRADRTDRELLADFTSGHDPSAFADLVRRHGPMVLGVCRRVLGNVHDAEDAFQAAFLVLARKAASVRKGDSLASFLHGVAYRVALRARRDAARRRSHEGRARPAPASNPASEAAWREVQGILDEEVDTLPADFRSAFVLCCLEGLSKPEAARRLGVHEGTLSSRLARARRRLRERLARRGVALSAVPAVPLAAALAESTASAAVLFAAGEAPGLASARLAEGVLKGMLAQKLKPVGALMLALALLGAGLGVLAGRPAPAGSPAERAAPARTAPADAPEEKAESIVVRGRVVDPAGKPVPKASVYLVGPGDKEPRNKPRGVSGSGGSFRFRFDPEEFVRPDGRAQPWRSAGIVALADGFGPALASAERAAEGELTLRLVPDLPIEGRVMTLEGKPVAGAIVRLWALQDWGGEAGLTAYLRAVAGGTAPPRSQGVNRVPGRANEWKTDEGGRFRLTGLGRDRIALLDVSGPGIARKPIQVMTRAGKPVVGRVSWAGEAPVTIYPAKFTYSAKPGRALTGIVRDEKTGKPVAGIGVNGEDGVVTDAKGRYELGGLAKGEEHRLFLRPARGDVPYIPIQTTVADTPGRGPIRADLAMRRGIPLRVRVTDRVTGKPVRAWVYYIPLFPNEDVPANSLGLLQSVQPQPDGSFSGAVLPGPGAVCAMHEGGRYRPASVDQKKFFRLERMPKDEKRFPSSENLWTGGRNPNPLSQSQFQAIALIDPKPDARELSLHLKLDPGRAGTVRLRDPGGEPLGGVRVWDWRDQRWSLPLAGAERKVTGLAPKKPAYLLLRHEGKKLAGAVTVKGDEPGPVTVTLRPWGTVTGRLVDRAGKPLANHQLGAGNPPPGRKRTLSLPGEVRTDERGRFRIDGLVPGYEYHLRVERYFPDFGSFAGVGKLAKPVVARPGEHDLGDVRLAPFAE